MSYVPAALMDFLMPKALDSLALCRACWALWAGSCCPGSRTGPGPSSAQLDDASFGRPCMNQAKTSSPNESPETPHKITLGAQAPEMALALSQRNSPALRLVGRSLSGREQTRPSNLQRRLKTINAWGSGSRHGPGPFSCQLAGASFDRPFRQPAKTGSPNTSSGKPWKLPLGLQVPDRKA